jgi:Protein of unknown function (DUF2849)
VKILTGNDLGSGDVVWWTGDSWSRAIGDAVAVGDDFATIIARESAAERVNAAYDVEAEVSPTGPLPLHIKDRVRAAGPTVRQDLGVNPAIQIVKG